MRAISVNYGLKGGTLDATKHLEAAIPRLLTSAEQAERDAMMRAHMGHTLATQPGRERAALN